jgi:hypothetical protein
MVIALVRSAKLLIIEREERFGLAERWIVRIKKGPAQVCKKKSEEKR